MIKKLLHGKINSIATAALLVAFSSLLSRLLGVMRDRILASSFGAGSDLDVYYAAFRLPDAMYNLLVLGVLSAGFIPLFSKKIKNDSVNQDEAWGLANNLLNVLGLALTVFAVLGMVFAGKLIMIFLPGFSLDKQILATSLTRLMFLSPLILGLSGVVGGMLQSFGRFFTYSLAPIFYNIGVILGALFLAPKFGPLGLAMGVVLGALMHLIVQLPTLKHLGYRYSWVFDLRSPDFIKLVKLMVPRTLALAITQIDLTVSTVIASTLAVGSLTVFNLANNLQFFPIGIIGISFATAAFPLFAKYALNKSKLIEEFSKVERQILFFIVPATILFVVLRAQIVRVVLGAGAFTWNDTILTFDTLGLFSISLFAQASIPLLVRVYYAREDSRRPFYIGLITVVVDVVAALLLSKVMGVKGLALAFSIASVINFTLLWLVLRRELGSLDEQRIFKSLGQFIVAGLACGLVAQGMKVFLGTYLDLNYLIEVIAQGALAGIASLTAYLGVCVLLGNSEARGFLARFKEKITPKSLKNTDQSEARGV